MNLTALSEEYRSAADRLQERLRELRAYARTARGEEAFAAQRRIDALRAELYDLRVVMDYLRHYYD
ncbi:hypothetical protein [uncultured Anaerotruncus sp.]|uniref:hypothetical protein n=1 Tax=uncultured Anaerotruncus sp. TaxID=905011 RepID=UPI00280B411F|nr:hypothetical protein [uncultured Anaerotruncus sp.]